MLLALHSANPIDHGGPHSPVVGECGITRPLTAALPPFSSPMPASGCELSPPHPAALDKLTATNLMIRSRYARWMNDWEYRLETRDSNRVVRPFEWGLDWTADFPGVSSRRRRHPASPEAQKRYFFDLNDRLIANSDEFFGYKTPTDFRLEQRPIRVHGTGSHANPGGR